MVLRPAYRIPPILHQFTTQAAATRLLRVRRADSLTMADLQELFSRLKSPTANEGAPQSSSAQQQPSIWAQPSSNSYQPPSVSSPLFSPPLQTPNPVHSSAIMSPAHNTPAPDPKANNLLNLLKFNTNVSASTSSPLAAMQNINAPRSPSLGQSTPSAVPSGSARGVSASDVVASFHHKPSPSATMQLPLASAPFRQEGVTSPVGNPQDFLLNLLNRPKQASSEPLQAPQPQQPSASVEKLAEDLADTILASELEKAKVEPSRTSREATPARLFGTTESREATPSFEGPPQPASKPGIFTYVNPFEALSASSPRKLTPKPTSKAAADAASGANGDADAAPAAKARKLASPAPSPLPDGRSKIESLMGIGAEPKNQSVAEALSGVGERVDKQLEEVLAQAEGASAGQSTAAAAAATGNTEEDVADSWESADLEETPKEDGGKVLVYNFPMRPFVSIQINKTSIPSSFRSDSLVDIARMKKDFDQIDRSLVTASQHHIVYALPKNSGFRVIQQETGRDKSVFRSGSERIFNLQMCTTSSSVKDTESVLGTGVNGSVYWTTFSKSVTGEEFVDSNPESQGFVLPPVPVQDDNTSGSPVKTRAKMSSRHVEFFGISRGKSIYIIAPLVARSASYTDPKTRIVDHEKFLQDHSFKIVTGKAGKDFTFSEDDSLLVSLDKSGRIKFWDIREIAERARDAFPGKRNSIEQKAPLMTLITTSPAEKATPSSVMFVDKERPCVKGVALRYLIVGLKQNHILQLWDLGLGKPVQELHFPHDKDSDAICSIAYHPKSGIIALGHPTRNSIYFIHLSAPRYHIPNLDQARYVTMVAAQDTHLPRPESTAIMSGIREYSFAQKGELRSVEMLKTPANPSDSEEELLFELYAMHSKGVTCLKINRTDLGWGPDNKVQHPVDAENAGVISVHDIRVPPAPVASDVTGETPAKVRSTITEDTSAPQTPARQKSETTKSVLSRADKPEISAVNGTNKASKKKQAAAEEPAPAASQPAVNPPIITPASYAMAAQSAKPSIPEPEPVQVNASIPVVETRAKSPAAASGFNKSDIDGITKDVTSSMSGIFSKELDALYKHFDDDRRVQDAAAAAKQDAVLRLVSSTLTDNVEKSLSKMITAGIQQTLLPALTSQINSTIEHTFSQALASAVPRAMQDKDVHRSISEQTASKLTAHIDQTVNAAVRNLVLPAVTNLSSSTQKSAADAERRFAEQLRQVEARRLSDNAKIAELTDLARGMSDIIQAVSAGQAAFQEQILQLQSQIAASNAAREASDKSAASVRSQPAAPSQEDLEVQTVTQLMTDGKYEEATIAVCIFSVA